MKCGGYYMKYHTPQEHIAPNIPYYIVEPIGRLGGVIVTKMGIWTHSSNSYPTIEK